MTPYCFSIPCSERRNFHPLRSQLFTPCFSSPALRSSSSDSAIFTPKGEKIPCCCLVSRLFNASPFHPDIRASEIILSEDAKASSECLPCVLLPSSIPPSLSFPTIFFFSTFAPCIDQEKRPSTPPVPRPQKLLLLQKILQPRGTFSSFWHLFLSPFFSFFGQASRHKVKTPPSFGYSSSAQLPAHSALLPPDPASPNLLSVFFFFSPPFVHPQTFLKFSHK